MELEFTNKDNYFKKNDKVLVMQEIDELPRIVSHGIVSYTEKDRATVYVDNNNFVSSFPFYIIKTSEMIEVSAFS